MLPVAVFLLLTLSVWAAALRADRQRPAAVVAGSWAAVGVAAVLWAATAHVVPGRAAQVAAPVVAVLAAAAVTARIRPRPRGAHPHVRPTLPGWVAVGSATGRTLLLVGLAVGLVAAPTTTRPHVAGWFCGRGVNGAVEVVDRLARPVAAPLLPAVTVLAAIGGGPHAGTAPAVVTGPQAAADAAGPSVTFGSGQPGLCEVDTDGWVQVTGRAGQVDTSPLLLMAPARTGRWAPGSATALHHAADVERAHTGIAPLVHDPTLAAVAAGHARDMAGRGYVSHYTLECHRDGAVVDVDGCGDIRTRTDAAAVDSVMVGENVAVAGTVAAVHHGWMASPSHRAAILDPAFSHVGIAVMEVPAGLVAVQVFADHRTVADLLAVADPDAYMAARAAGRVGTATLPRWRPAIGPAIPGLPLAGWFTPTTPA